MNFSSSNLVFYSVEVLSRRRPCTVVYMFHENILSFGRTNFYIKHVCSLGCYSVSWHRWSMQVVVVGRPTRLVRWLDVQSSSLQASPLALSSAALQGATSGLRVGLSAKAILNSRRIIEISAMFPNICYFAGCLQEVLIKAISIQVQFPSS